MEDGRAWGVPPSTSSRETEPSDPYLPSLYLPPPLVPLRKALQGGGYPWLSGAP